MLVNSNPLSVGGLKTALHPNRFESQKIVLRARIYFLKVRM